MTESSLARNVKIGVERLSHEFEIDGRTVPALVDASLEIAAGEFLAIVGPSGCGKSTLLDIASGLLPPTTGRVTIDSAPVRASSAPTPRCSSWTSPSARSTRRPSSCWKRSF